jgi:hypothetical protein
LDARGVGSHPYHDQGKPAEILAESCMYCSSGRLPLKRPAQPPNERTNERSALDSVIQSKTRSIATTVRTQGGHRFSYFCPWMTGSEAGRARAVRQNMGGRSIDGCVQSCRPNYPTATSHLAISDDHPSFPPNYCRRHRAPARSRERERELNYSPRPH